MDSVYIEFAAILALILANGFFAASEFALIASRRSRILNLARKGDKRAARTRQLLKKPERFLAAVQVGITFIGTLAGVFSGATVVDSLTPLVRQIPVEAIRNTAQPIAIATVVILVSVFTVLLGELIPKYIALSNPEKIALIVTRPIALLSRLLFFFVGFLTLRRG
jgi:putative hemolysin